MYSSNRRFYYLSALISATLLLAACGSDAVEPKTPDVGGVRTIMVKTLDTLRFDPETINVAVGEKVRFVVANAGQSEHEFVVGDQDVQAAHEMAMTGGSHSQGESKVSIQVKPGETEEDTVTFDEPGELIFGCHIAGHYGAGMRGTIKVA